jgi:hypothetical protein
MTSYRSTLIAGLTTVALAACGGGGNDVDPTLIPGGGIANPGIDGEVNVYVIDEDTDDPIQGAMVHVGDVEGETDADGLFVATGVSGPQVITAMIDGYVPSTWVGANGANVTIPLSEPTSDPGNIPRANLTGTIDGWASMQAPAAGALVAFIGVSASQDDDDPGNDIQQPTGNPPPNSCVKLTGQASDCDWSVISRTGQVAIFAFLGDMDANQNITVHGFAYETAVVVEDGVDQEGFSLTVADGADLLDADISLPSAPAGTDTIDAVVEVDLGADGRLLLPQTGDLVLPVPATTLFDGSSHNVFAVAQTASGEDGPQSIRMSRAVDVEAASIPTFLPIPADFETDGALFSLTPVEGATLMTFGVREADGTELWDVAIFDDSTEVPLHEHLSFPAGTLTYRVQAIEIPGIDLEDFTLDGVEDTVTGVAADSVTFTN